jgi:hypothetical protein
MSGRLAFEAIIARAKAMPIGDAALGLGLRLKKITPVEFAGACPRCGGRDRFSVNIRKGVFNCRGCAAGGGVIAMVEHVKGCSFVEAVTSLTGEAMPARAAPLQTVMAGGRSSSDWWRTIWRESRAPIEPPAKTYLERRLLPPPYPVSLRFHPSLKSRDDGGKPRPAMGALIGLIRRWSGEAGRTEPIGVTCAFVQRDGAPAFPGSNRRFHGSCTGGGVWLLIEPSLTLNALEQAELVAGEGIETTLSAMRLWGARAGVAALCAGGVKTLVLPPAIRRVRIAADLDLNEAGQDAAVEAAERWRSEGRQVRVTLPARQVPYGALSFDFNDLLLRTSEAA